MDFSQLRSVHMLGIKGAGLAGLAQLLAARGIDVCGSDTNEEFFTDDLLHKKGIPIEDFSEGNITSSLDLVIYSTAYPLSHPELVSALAQKIPIMSYPEALAQIFNASFGIAVSGSHGKTTTSAMITYILVHLNLDPTALVGSTIAQLGSNIVVGSSPYFVMEADEYQNKFSYYNPKMLVMTNIDYDHPDYFKTEEDYRTVFREFAEKITDRHLVACWDDEGVRKSLVGMDAKNIITYGWNDSYNYSASNYHIENGRRAFTCSRSGITVGDFSLSLIGRYNVDNALAAMAVVETLGLCSMERAAEILQEFTGTARRFEYKGQYKNITVIDDYGHHPTEIRATLHAARHQYPDKKIWCVFGAHTYSRTKTFLSQFGDAFHHVDRVLILDIYTSARETEQLVNANDLVAAINIASKNATFTPTHKDALDEIIAHADEFDILITMGAGDVYKIADTLTRGEPRAT